MIAPLTQAREADARPTIAPHVWLLLLGVLLLGECALLAACFDAAPLLDGSRSWWAQIISRAGVVMPLATAVVTATVLLGGARLRDELRLAALRPEDRRWSWLVGHLAAFTVFFWLTRIVFGSPQGAPPSGWWAVLWTLAGAAEVTALGRAALPLPVLVTVAWRVLALLLACVAVGVLAWGAGQVTGEWWYPLGRSTLWVVSRMLPLVVPDAFVRPDTFIVGTPGFQIEIASRCSGYEGIGLIWVFLGVYLWTFRRALRFPHALLLLPLGTAAMWVANTLRITGLIWIGSAVSPDIALGGFHANSGSLLLCVVALGIAWGAHHSPSLARQHAPAAMSDAPAAVGAYLTPFLLTVVVAMASGLATPGGFDRMYGLRVLAVSAALAVFRREYPPWRWSWSFIPVASGVAVMVLWVLLAPPAGGAPDPTAGALAAMEPGWRTVWIICRLVGAVVTVPVAEELAFRGYLARRLIAHDFQQLSLKRLSWSACVGSALVFGALHDRFVAATIAGVVYAIVARRRGELADAVVAHATTNALLAAWVLRTGHWSLW